MKQLLNIIMTGIVTLSLTACGTMNSSFDCPNKAGVMCKSLDQVNTMVDNGQIRGRSQMSVVSENGNLDFTPYPETTGYFPGQPIRYGETVQRIWVTPYEDAEGNYHDDSTLYTVVKKGRWIGNPPKVITQS